MKFLLALVVAAAISFTSASTTLVKRANPQGIDVSHWQGTINWNTVKANGVSFVYIKATEGTSECLLVIWFSTIVRTS